MYIWMYVCISVCMYTCTYVYVCMYVLFIYVCVCLCMYVRMYVCVYVCMYVCMYVRMYICMYECLYDVCMCMYYVCMYVLEYFLYFLLCLVHYCGIILYALSFTLSWVLLSVYTIYSLDPYNLLNTLFWSFIYCLWILWSFCKFLYCLSLLTGQFSDRVTPAFSFFRSCSRSVQSNNMWQIDCSSLLQEHFGLCTTLYLYKYILLLPWPVTITVKLGVALIINFNLSAILGKNNFVNAFLEDLSHSLYYIITLSSFSSPITSLFGFLL